MTDTSKDAVERLLDGVTPGPWAPDNSQPPDENGALGIDAPGWSSFASAVVKMVDEDGINADGVANLHFIAASRELVPALLAKNEALTAEVARLTAERDAFEAALGRACLVGGTTYLVERAEKAFSEISRLTSELDDERSLADELADALDQNRVAADAIAAHAKRRRDKSE